MNFGIVYGIGAFSLARDIGVSVAEADRYIQDYLRTYSGVKRYMDDIVAFGKEHGYVETMFHRRRYLPELAASNKNLQAFGKRVAMNTPIQGTAADIIKIAMVKAARRLEKEKLDARIILQVHDELIIEAAEKDVEAAKILLRQEMENAVQLKVPLRPWTAVSASAGMMRNRGAYDGVPADSHGRKAPADAGGAGAHLLFRSLERKRLPGRTG